MRKDPDVKRRKRGWSRLAALLVTLLFVYLTLRDFDPERFLSVLERVHWLPLLSLVPILLLTHFFRALRWWSLVARRTDARPWTLFPYILAGMALSDLIPVRAGEWYRAWLLTQRHGLPYSSSLGVVVVERVLDGLSMALVLLLALFMTGSRSDGFRSLLVAALPLFGLAGLLLLALFLWPERFEKRIPRFCAPFPSTWRPRLEDILRRFADGLESLADSGAFLRTVLFTFGQWAVEGVAYVLLFRAFGFQLGYEWGLLMLAVISFATVLPAGPGYVGVFEYAVMLVLLAAGVDRSAALGAAVVLHGVQLAVAVGPGTVFLALFGLEPPGKLDGEETR